jgi:Flp pilus assembly pilin Flp
MHPRSTIIRRLLRDERGSQALEAAGAALAAMLIVLALLSGAGTLSKAVKQAMMCATSAINGGGAGCGGGAAATNTGGGGSAPQASGTQQARNPLLQLVAAINPFGTAAQAQPANAQTGGVQAPANMGGNQPAANRQQAGGSNAILNDLQTNGAQRTAQQDNLNITGVAASQRMAQTDRDRVAQYAADFRAAGERYGIPPAILAGIASRETRGRPIGSNNSAGAWGLMQVLNGSRCNCEPGSSEHIDQAARLLRSKLDEVRAAHPDWTPAQQMRGAIAAYNFGSRNVQTIERMDVGTDNGDYSADVWARAQYYAQDPAFGGQGRPQTQQQRAPARSGSPAEIAQRLLDNRNIAQEGNRNRTDGSNPLDNLRAAAQGQAARTSRDAANATRDTATVNPNLLRGLDSLSSRYRIGISAITGGAHGNNSYHYTGDAVDIATVNGKAVQNMTPAEIASFSRAIRALPGFRGYLGPDRNDGNHGDHFHINFNR